MRIPGKNHVIRVIGLMAGFMGRWNQLVDEEGVVIRRRDLFGEIGCEKNIRTDEFELAHRGPFKTVLSILLLNVSSNEIISFTGFIRFSCFEKKTFFA